MINRIGLVLAVIGILLFGICGGLRIQGADTTLSNVLCGVGLLIGICGTVMVNIDRERM